jgi:hypothetical protein
MHCLCYNSKHSNNNKSVALVRERTLPTGRPPLVSELSANFGRQRFHVVSAADPYGRNLGFLDRRRYFFFQVAPQLYSRGWVNPVPDPLLLRKSGSAGNSTRDLWICSQELRPPDHRGGPLKTLAEKYFETAVTNQRRIQEEWREDKIRATLATIQSRTICLLVYCLKP